MKLCGAKRVRGFRDCQRGLRAGFGYGLAKLKEPMEHPWS